MTITNGIQSGAVIHHHDQSIYFKSFKTIKTIVKSPRNDIPELLLEVLEFFI